MSTPKKKSAAKRTADPLAVLRGKRIAVTRTPEKNNELVERLRAVKAEVLELPLIRVMREPTPEGIEEVFAEFGAYEWVVFTSANGVQYFFEHFFERFRDIRALGLARIAAIGPATEAAIREFHLNVDLVPPAAVAESLAEALDEFQSVEHLRILVVTGNRNRPVIVDRLTQGKAIVDTLAVYRTEKTDLRRNAAARSFRESGADAILFASSSAAESFLDQAGSLQLAANARHPLGCSIGPITSDTMRKCGIPVDVEATDATMDSLLAALAKRLKKA